MAIQMSSATVGTDARQELLQKKVDSTGMLTGGANQYASGETWGGMETLNAAAGASVAGISDNFVPALKTAIISAVSEIEASINDLIGDTSGIGIEGTEIQSKLLLFGEAVKNVAKQFSDGLNAAEQEIISSVEKVYTQQDTSISSDLNNDSNSLSVDK